MVESLIETSLYHAADEIKWEERSKTYQRPAESHIPGPAIVSNSVSDPSTPPSAQVNLKRRRVNQYVIYYIEKVGCMDIISMLNRALQTHETINWMTTRKKNKIIKYFM